MQDIATVDVSVTPILKEFYISTYGSDTIPVTQKDIISVKIKYLLEIPPVNYKPKREFSETLKIQLLNFRIGKKHISKDSSNYLSVQAQRILFDELNRGFKDIFHNYVLAYVRGNNYKDGSQKKGILDFCDTYKLSMNKINYEMLKKSWDRSKQKIHLYD
jgi:hypothetical protein